MRVVQAPIAPSTPDQRSGTDGKGGGGGGGFRDKDAESLFRTKPISEIRNVEATTRKQIQDKSEELRQLVGNRYRDLIDSADSIVLMKSSCESISANISAIHDGILRSLSSTADFAKSTVAPDPARTRIYGIACRVKYLVDTLENIWGCLDESMFLEAAARYIRAKHVHQSLAVIRSSDNRNVLSNFPLLQHQWQIVESFKTQISQRSRERLLDHALGLGIAAYADALAAVVIIDKLDPHQVLSLFLDSRKSCISKKLGACSHDSVTSSDVISVFCEVLKIIQVTIGQVGELFLQVLNDMPLFYKTILGSPPASQLFGGIPNPDEEIRMWNLFRDKLESLIVMLDRNFIAKTCSEWLRNCGKEIVNKINGRYLVDAISSGQQLAEAEKLMRETMESRQVLEGSLEWLKSVFGSEIELPWKRTRELVLGDDSNLWDEIFEDAFVQRMKAIIESGFDELSKVVNVLESVHAIADAPCDRIDFQAYLKRLSSGGGVWFTEPNAKKVGSLSNFKAQLEENDFCSCLNVYFGAEVSRIRDAVDSCCENMLEDLLCFLESPNASFRLKDLVPYIQNKCYGTLTDILMKLKDELGHLQDCLGKGNENDESMPPLAVIVERSLFIGRLLFAFQKHSRHIPVVLGSPRLWINETMTFVSDNSPILLRSYSRSVTDSPIFDSPGRKMFDSSKRKTSLATSALFGVADSSSPQHEDLSRTIQDLCIRAHDLWISWVSNELADILSHSLRQDDGLSATTPLRGWEEIVVKQEESDADQTEIKLLLPSIPSLFITSFLFQACEEIHRVGGHILDKSILQNFASTLLEKVLGTYEDFLSSGEVHWLQVSEKGILQILLDLRFVTDVLSGGDFSTKSDTSKVPKMKLPSKQKQDIRQVNSAVRERLDGLVNRLSQRLDPIDWLTYEPYLWENERMSCRRHAVLFGFFVQLNQMYMDNVHKYSAHSNSESNIMRCSTVPRFKYLPISAPVLSSKGSVKISPSASVDDASLRSPWKNYTNDEISRKIDIDEHSSFGVATPFLKSFMQVGRGFGESTLKLGSMLTDGQVGRFGDILPAQAAGLLSSFTTARSDF